MNTPSLPLSILLVVCAFAGACARHSGSVAPVTPQGSPQFETRIEVNTGTGDHSAFDVADFDGDTFLDMAVVSTTGQLKILLGNGTNFVDGQLLEIGGTPVWIDGGDFDSDGDRDLVVLMSSAGVANTYLNDGSGTFTVSSELLVGADVRVVKVGDASGDGVLDIVVTRQVAPELFLFTGDGAGNFTQSAVGALPGGGSAFNAAIGDVTRDSVADLLVADPINSRVLIYSGGVPGFGAPFELDIAGEPRAISLGDLSGDGFTDICVSAFLASEFVIVTGFDQSSGSGPVSFTSQDVEVAAPAAISTIGDVTGDGLLDLVGCQLGNASIVVVPQAAAGGFGEHLQYDATGLPLVPFVGDFDQNGSDDLFALSGLGDRVNLWLARSTGSLVGSRNFDAGVDTASFLAGGDLDGDGDNEVVVGSPGGTQVSIMEWRGDDSIEAVHFIDIGAVVLQIHAIDLDVDGKLDLLAAVEAGLKVLRNRSDGSGYDFEVLPGLAVTIGSASAPFGVTAADFDRDGDFDLAVCDYGGNALHIVQGTAVPFVYGAETVIPIEGGPVDVVAADFTGDEYLDIAISREMVSDIVILRNDGVGGFSQFLMLPVGQSPNYLITGDFNRDLRSDLVVSNADSGTITVLFGGASSFTGQSHPAGQTPTALLAGDLTDDGIDDILVTSLQSGDFRVLVGDGFGSFPELTRFPGTLGASDALLLDVDGDVRQDLLIASLITSRVSLVLSIGQ